jgi:hypothetical protein
MTDVVPLYALQGSDGHALRSAETLPDVPEGQTMKKLKVGDRVLVEGKIIRGRSSNGSYIWVAGHRIFALKNEVRRLPARKRSGKK